MKLYQAIQVRILPATSTKPTRIQAWCDGGTYTETRHGAKTLVEAAAEVAEKLARKMGWGNTTWVCGGLPGKGEVVFVQTTTEPWGDAVAFKIERLSS